MAPSKRAKDSDAEKPSRRDSEITAEQVASYFLSMQDDTAGDLISNLKLQKLLYYAQGLHLAMYNNPLFSENIKAWVHGPVVPHIYHLVKQYESEPIPVDAIECDSIEDEEVTDFLSEIYSVFGQYSAWKLRNMTHHEKPYLDMQDYGGEISHKSMQKFFKKYLVDDSEE